MKELVQIVRRHEETAKDENGKKLDRPTPEGVATAYQRGLDLKGQYPDHVYYGRHSDKKRTQICLNAWMMGANPKTSTYDYPTHRLGGLNPPRLGKEQLDKIRNTDDVTAQRELLYNNFSNEVERAGYGCAELLHHGMLGQSLEDKEHDRLFLHVTSAPVVEAAYLILRGIPISFENVRDYAGFCAEGEGFDIISKAKCKDAVIINNGNEIKVDVDDVEDRIENIFHKYVRD